MSSVSSFLTETDSCPLQTQEGIWLDVLQGHKPLTIQEVKWLFDYEFRTRYRLVGQPFEPQEDYIYYESLCEKMIEYQKSQRVKPKSHAGHELGAREFTLTYSPKWMDDSTARIEMSKAIDKLCKYYVDDIVELRAVGEVGSNGLSHIHCFYKLRAGLKITDKNFKRAWKYWNPKKKIGNGFEGGHHQTIKEEADFKGYIDKDVDSAWFEKNIKNL